MLKLFYFLTSMVIMVLLTGCQSTQNTERSFRINFTDGDLPSLLPSDLQSHIRGRTIGKLLYETLVSKTSEGKLEPAGAEKIEVSADGREYLFTLRKHFWSDGSRVNALDYANTWKSFLNPRSECAFGHLLYIIKNAKLAKEGKISLDSVGITALDNDRLLITLEYPNPYCLEIFSHQLFSAVKKDKEGNFCFNGPFIVEKWEKERQLCLKANPLFWNQKNIRLSSIVISYVTDSSTAFSMYQRNELDWIGEPFSPLKVEDIEYLKQEGTIIQETTNRPLAVYFNTKKKPFNSPFIRKALSQVIDRKFLTEHILQGDLPLSTPLPVRLTLCTSSLDCNLIDAKMNFEKGLHELGLTLTDLPAFELNYPDVFKNLCTMLKEIWEKTFGIKVTLRGLEWNTLKSNLENGSYTMGCCVISSFFPDPIELLERFETENTNNFCKWINPQFQENLSLARQSSDIQKRAELLKKAEEIIEQEMPFIPISNRNHTFSHPKNLKNILIDSSGYVDLRWVYWTAD